MLLWVVRSTNTILKYIQPDPEVYGATTLCDDFMGVAGVQHLS